MRRIISAERGLASLSIRRLDVPGVRTRTPFPAAQRAALSGRSGVRLRGDRAATAASSVDNFAVGKRTFSTGHTESALTNGVADFTSRDAASIATAIRRLSQEKPPAAPDDAALDDDDQLTKLLAEATSSITQQPDCWKAGDLAAAACAAARYRRYDPPLYDAIARAAVARIGDFKPWALANTAWAFSAARVSAPALYDAIAQAAESKIGGFIAPHLAKMAWAFSISKYAAPALYDAIARAAEARIGKFGNSDLATTVSAFSNAKVAAPALFDAAASLVESRIATFDLRDLASTARAFSVAGAASPAFADLVVTELLKKKAGSASVQTLDKVHRALLSLRHEAAKHSSKIAAFSQNDLAIRAASVSGAQAHDPLHSEMQLRASRALLRLGWKHKYEYVTAEGFSLDMAQPKRKRAVEFDGPTHYIRGLHTTPVLDGKTVAKDRELRRLGWQVLRIPYFDWQTLRSTQAQDLYLRMMLAKWQVS